MSDEASRERKVTAMTALERAVVRAAVRFSNVRRDWAWDCQVMWNVAGVLSDAVSRLVAARAKRKRGRK